MEEFKFPLMITALLSLILLSSIYKTFLKLSRRRKLPPSPWKLPIIGNLHQLSPLLHQDLHLLAQKHGPLMLLHFGSVPVLIVSSAEVAREMLTSHDLVFSSRPSLKAAMKLFYGGKDVAFSPYGEYWRKVKSIFVLQLLSNRRVQSFRIVREEETALFMKEIEGYSTAPVNLSEMLLKVNSDSVCRSAFGNKYYESENGKRFLRVMNEMTELVGAINIGDFIPWLGWISCVNGFDKRLDNASKEMDGVLEKIIQERTHEKEDESGENFLDILIGICNDDTADASIDRDSIKALILDVFLAGTETISASVEWAMSELLRNPAVMEKLQREIRGITKQKQEITDNDLEKMQYLKAVIKETLRIHPPGPLLAPRIATEDVQIKGFDVSAGTMVMINVWTMGRNPAYWDEPEKFKPERFLNSSIDFKGLDFKFIPFGAGRRGCPGTAYSIAAIEFMLANLVKKFDWKLPNGMKAEDLDMNESIGQSAHRLLPLLAVASLSR